MRRLATTKAHWRCFPLSNINKSNTQKWKQTNKPAPNNKKIKVRKQNPQSLANKIVLILVTKQGFYLFFISRTWSVWRILNTQWAFVGWLWKMTTNWPLWRWRQEDQKFWPALATEQVQCYLELMKHHLKIITVILITATVYWASTVCQAVCSTLCSHHLTSF